jgi:hypothetical protein
MQRMPKRVIGFPLELRNNEVHPAMEGFRNLDFVFVISNKPKRKALKEKSTRYSPGFSRFKKAWTILCKSTLYSKSSKHNMLYLATIQKTQDY